MTTLKVLTYIGKLSGLLASLHTIPFVEPQTGVLIFLGASIVKDTVNRIGDVLDDGIENKSWTSHI